MVRANEEERSGGISLFDNEEEIYKFKATITYCRYYNDSSTWGVYGFSTDDDIPHFTKETKIDLPFEDKKEVNPNRKLSTLAGKSWLLVENTWLRRHISMIRITEINTILFLYMP